MTMNEVICPYCGTPNRPEDDRCKSCHRPLDSSRDRKSRTPEREDLDWLAGFRGDTSDLPQNPDSPAESGDQESGQLEEAEIPEWLERIRRRSMEDRMRHEMQTRRLGPDTSSHLPASGEESDVSKDKSPEEEASAQTPQEPEQTEQDTGEPETFADLTALEEPYSLGLEEPQLAEKESSETEDATDWLEQILPEKPDADFEFPGRELPTEFADEEPAADEESEKDTWKGTELETFPEGAGQGDFKTELPDWFEESEVGSGEELFMEIPGDILPESEQAEEAEPSGELAGSPIPAEMTESEAEISGEVEPSLPPKKESELEEAHIPGWLEAIRPIESVAPERFAADADNQTETQGPLAGFQGVIPAGELVSRTTKSPDQSLKLQVSEKQSVYAGLLENLIADEGRPAEHKPEKAAAPSAVLRFLVGLILIGLLAFLLVNGTQFSQLPRLYPLETVTFYDSFQQLRQLQQPPARVLVAADYEPALTGEIQTIASLPIRQLLETGSLLVLVSTVPGGPALGQQLVENAANGLENFQLEDQVINLGYLVGGSASLASLAVQPSTAAPARLDGTYAWDSPILAGIQSVADFDGLVLLTDNPETARAWVEQVQLHLGGRPLLVISSAQAAPMILPYYQSNQIQGVMAGLSGSAVYEQLAGNGSSPTRAYWDAYQAGILVVIAAILIGGLISAVQAALQRRTSRKRN